MDFREKPVPNKTLEGARFIRGLHSLPKPKARPRARGRPRERPTDETWPGKEPSIAHAPTGSAVSKEPWRSPGKNGALQPQESSRTKESRGKSHQEATRGPLPSIHRKYRSPKGGGPRHKKRVDKESQPTAPPKEPLEMGISKSLQEQERTTSIRRAHLSQAKEAPDAKRQAGAGPQRRERGGTS